MPDIGKADFARPDVAHHIHDERRSSDLTVIFGALGSISFSLLTRDFDVARDQPQMVFVIDRREAEVDFRPAACAVHARKRRHDDPRNVRSIVQRLAHLAVPARAEAEHTPFGFLRRYGGEIGGELGMRRAWLMGKRYVDL